MILKMSPNFMIGGRAVVVDVFNAGVKTLIFPRVKMGETMARELQATLGGKVCVNFDPSAEYVPVRFETGTVDIEETLRKIEAFLRTNDSRWFLYR
ncbi:MAG: hypothetical protein Q7R84_01155 [bacterium]|nr:hypothetical protein [bacterium]